jgi:AraC-like DNA-binding protein
MQPAAILFPFALHSQKRGRGNAPPAFSRFSHRRFYRVPLGPMGSRLDGRGGCARRWLRPGRWARSFPPVISDSVFFSAAGLKCLRPSSCGGGSELWQSVIELSFSEGHVMKSRLDWIRNWEHRFRKCGYKASTVAEGCGVTLRFLENYFHLRFATTPHTWSLRVRMSDAERLLAQGMAVKVVALELGYSKVGNFCRDFKRFHGATPREYSFRDS